MFIVISVYFRQLSYDAYEQIKANVNTIIQYLIFSKKSKAKYFNYKFGRHAIICG